METSKFDKAIHAWLNDAHGRGYRFNRAIRGIYYNKLPREFRFYGVLHWVVKTAIASSAPAFAWAYGSISGGLAVAATSAIFGGHSFASFLDKMSREKAVNVADNQSDILVRFGDLLIATKSKAAFIESDKDDAIRACLSILEIFSRQITKSRKGDVSVSLVLYSGSSRNKMKIRHRNAGNERPLNREFDAQPVLGHHACEAGAFPRVVHDIGAFGRSGVKSPTQSKVSYRSIFIIPLEVPAKDGNTVRGFVSIDSRHPFAFYGNRSNVIIVTCEPIVNHLRELLQEGNNVRVSKR